MDDLDELASGDLGLRPALVLVPPSPAHFRPLPPVPNRRSTAENGDGDGGNQDEQLKAVGISHWINYFAEVVFNPDLGPELLQLYPSPLQPSLSKRVSTNIAFSSLPDGEMRTASGVCVFSWRIVNVDSKGDGAGVAQEEGDESLFGFVYFVQQVNKELKRSYSQKSLVLISTHSELPGLFSTLISILGPLYFKLGSQEEKVALLQRVEDEISPWPNPTPGLLLELPFLTHQLRVEIPLVGQSQWSAGGLDGFIPASLPITPLSTSLHSYLTYSKILLLWELLILGEPLLVFVNDVTVGSELAWWLRGFGKPMLFQGEFRPHLHIHDIDFPKIVNSGKPKPGTIISTTNPLVLQSCKHWPHILRATKPGKGEPPGLTSPRKRHLKKDVEVEKGLEDYFRRGDFVGCDAIVFRHLTTLTERFLAPLNRYFGTLPSTDTSLSPPSTTSHFSPPAFLLSLKSHGTALQFRLSSPTTLESFYKKFLESPNYRVWLESRKEASGKEVRRKYLERLVGTDLREWRETGEGRGRDRKELEELEGRLRDEAAISDAAALLDPSTERVIPPASSSASSTISNKASANNYTNRNNNTNKQVTVGVSRGDLLRSQAEKLKGLRLGQ